jgi:anti-sigma B factor antagonist
MDVTQKRVQAARGAGSEVVRRNSSETAVRSTRAPLALVGLQPDRGCRRSAAVAAGDGRRPVVATQLVIRGERRRDTLIIWLSGALDRVTETVLDRELEARANSRIRLVVDLTELAFIDCSGLKTLLRIHRRAAEQGDRLSFRHGQQVAQRPLGLIRAAQLRSQWTPRPARLSDENSDIALAIAGAAVDHPPAGDGPEAS